MSFLQKIFSNTFYVCSRNINLHKKNNTTWWQIAEQEDIKNKLKKVGKNIAIQGDILKFLTYTILTNKDILI